MKKLLFVLSLLFVFSFVYGETVTLCDFESGDKGGYFKTDNKMEASTEFVSDAKEGSRAYKMSWDFTKVSDGFLNFDFYKETTGIIKSFTFWVYAEESLKGRSFNIWTGDVSGELYFASFTINEVGWQKVTAKVSNSIPWEAGDKNQKQDPPMKFMTICADVKSLPEKGYLIVDDIKAEVVNDIEEKVEVKTNKPEIDTSDTPIDQVWINSLDFEDSHTINTYTTDKAFYTITSIETQNVHGGKKSGKLSWKFTPDTTGGYNVYWMNCKAPGKIKEVSAWIYCDEKSKGTRITAWVPDETQEMYLGGVTLDETGWKEYHIKVSESSPWKSGDGDNQQTGNMYLQSFLVERNGSPIEGYILVDDIKLLVEAPYTNFVVNDLSVKGDEFFKVWGKNASIDLVTNNFSNENFTALNYKINVRDTNTGLIAKTLTVKNFSLKSQGTIKKNLLLTLPYSHYTVEVNLYNGNQLISYTEYPLTFLKGKCGVNIPPKMEEYLMNCAYWGGVTWEALPSFLREVGCRWTRGFRDDWKGIEYEKDKYNPTKLINSVKEYTKYGIDHILLMCTYNQPSWREYNHLDFAPAYGRLHEAIAKELAMNKYELGNEDNSARTKTYAEVGRNGAAGIRKYDSDALIANSATAGIDAYFFDVQKKKGLLDRLDLIIVHPYCNNNNPEDFGLYKNSQGMIDLIDSIGGYKNLWSTEYGYNDGSEGPSVLSDKTRSQYYVRHTLIQTASDYVKTGMFAWNYYWGVFVSSHGTLRGLSVETMCEQLEGYKFAGSLSLGDKLWIFVYEKLGSDPIAVAWTNEGEANFDLGAGLVYYDMYNNKMTKFKAFSEDPTYVHNISDINLKKAWDWTVSRELDRVNKLSGLNLSVNDSMDTYWAELNKLGENINDTNSSAASFHLLKAMLIKARYNKTPDIKGDDNFINNAKDYLEKARLEDKDYPKLRWALNEFENLEYEKQYAIEANSPFAVNLSYCEKILSEYATKYLMSDKDLRQNQVWAYLYDLDGTNIKEKLTFIPNVATRVKVRVTNYAVNPHSAKVSLDLPEGWKCEPEIQTIELTPGKDEITYFDVTATNMESIKNVSVTSKVDIGTGVFGTAIFTDIELISPVSVSQMASHGIHPQAPMEFAVRNSSDETHSGTIKVYSNNKLVGEGTFENLEPKTKKIYYVDLKETPADLDKMKVVVSGEGFIDSNQEFKTEYCFAPKGSVDIEKSESMNKYPLFIDKEEYDWGSFLGSWTPNDLSATSYFSWDNEYLYFRCLVTDNVFYQASKGDDTYMFDSVQIDIMNKDKRITQLCLAKMGDVDQVYMYRGPKGGVMKDIPCKIKLLKDQQDYLVAIPWKYIIDEGTPKAGDQYKIEILMNDHDITAPRRVLERFSDSIYHATAVTDEYGVLVLGE